MQYPYERWSRMSAADVEPLRNLARAEAPAWIPAACAALGTLVGTEVAVDSIRVRAPGIADGVPLGVSVHLVSSDGFERRCVVEVSPGMAATVVDRVLGGDGSGRTGGLSDGERGVVAFVAGQVLSACGGPFRVATVSTDGLTGTVPEACWTWSAVSVVDGVRFAVRLTGPAGGAPPTPRQRPRHLLVDFVLDHAEAPVAASALCSLRPDDVLFFDEAECFGARRRLRAHGASRRTWWVLGDRVAECETGEDAALPQGVRMENEPDTEATRGAGYDDPTRVLEGLAAVGDAPVTVSLEVARFRLPLDEVSRLAEGEVVLAGAAVGDEVRLRAGDTVIAVGELVNVDGQVGIRVRRLA